jgi:hypothetical protein
VQRLKHCASCSLIVFLVQDIDIKKIMEVDYLPRISQTLEYWIPRLITSEYLERINGRSHYENDPETLTQAISIPIYDLLDRGAFAPCCAR